MGGLVTSTGTGMSVPDWPNTWGYNMFAVPWEIWVGPLAGGVFYEHAHRLKGTLVGFLAISVMICAFAPAKSLVWRRRWGISAIVGLIATVLAVSLIPILHAAGIYNETFERHYSHAIPSAVSLFLISTVAWLSRTPEPRRWVRWSSVALLIAVCIQGLLGGLRVTEVNIQLAMVHACTAQAFLCFAGFMALATSRWWFSAPQVATSSSLPKLGALAVVLLFAQLTAGALMRHNDAGLAISTFPDTYGGILPPTTVAGLDTLNQQRIWNKDIGPVTSFQVWIHFIHRAGAVAVTAALIAIAVVTFRSTSLRQLRPWATALLLLLSAQIALGILTVLWRKPADIATAHVAVGALCMLATFLITAKSFRLAYNRQPLPRAAPNFDVLPPAHAAAHS
jgi:cytochrome c oxidase assembly protein subunit 15